MKIGADIRVLMDKHYSGISEYTANLLTAILRQDKENYYKLFYNSYHNLDDRFKSWNGDQACVIGRHWPNKIFNYLLQKVFCYPKLDQVLGGVDLFWSPHFNFTCLSNSESGLKKVITVHDLSFLRYPEFFSVRKNFWHRALDVKKTLRAAERIIAVSANTKNDIIELAGVAPEKISVIYSGNNAMKREEGVNPRSERFILYLGNIEPRKNISGLIAAYDKLRAEGENIKLVLAGAPGWKNKKIYAARDNSRYKNDIIFLGYISQKDKENLLREATIFVYPSYYEGFGFPPLEAMASGVPVVCSNISSLPEVVADAALMINPFKDEEIKDALKIILTDEKLRARLIAKGYERAKLFSWDKTAAQYQQLFKEVYEEKK